MVDRVTTLRAGQRWGWRVAAVMALAVLALAVSGEESHAEPAVDVSVTDTEITLSWESQRAVLFYWHEASGGSTKVERVSQNSHTITGLTPETKYRFFFWQGVIGELFVTTLATASEPDPEPVEEPEPSQDYAAVVESCVSDSLLNTVRGYYNAIQQRNPGGGKNWKRVLIAFNDLQDDGLGAYTAAAARAGESRWSGWKPVRVALECIEDANGAPISSTPAVVSEISVAAGPDIIEGQTLQFTFTASPAPTAPLSVNVNVDTPGHFVVAGGTKTITIPISGSYLMKLSSYDDSKDEGDGDVTATINSGSGYTVSSSSGSASLTVQDDDDPPLPVVSFTSASSSVTEGDDVELTITVNPAQTAPLDVSLSVVTVGDFGVTSGAQTVTIPTSGSVTHTIATVDDAVDEDDGSLTITIGAGTDYDVLPSNRLRYVTINDDDLTSAMQAVQSQDNTVAVVSFSSSLSSTVNEGNSFTLQIDASPAPTTSSPLNVKIAYRTVGTHSQVADAATAKRVRQLNTEGALVNGKDGAVTTWHEVSLTTATTTLTYTPSGTEFNDGSSTLTFTLLPSSRYNVDSGTRTVTITVNDTDTTPAVYGSCQRDHPEFAGGGPYVSTARAVTSAQVERYRTNWLDSHGRGLYLSEGVYDDLRTYGDGSWPAANTVNLIINRALVAFGESKPGLQPMAAADASVIRNTLRTTEYRAHFYIWRDIAFTLFRLEECAAGQYTNSKGVVVTIPPTQSQPTQQSQPSQTPKQQQPDTQPQQPQGSTTQQSGLPEVSVATFEKVDSGQMLDLELQRIRKLPTAPLYPGSPAGVRLQLSSTQNFTGLVYVAIVIDEFTPELTTMRTPFHSLRDVYAKTTIHPKYNSHIGGKTFIFFLVKPGVEIELIIASKSQQAAFDQAKITAYIVREPARHSDFPPNQINSLPTLPYLGGNKISPTYAISASGGVKTIQPDPTPSP